MARGAAPQAIAGGSRRGTAVLAAGVVALAGALVTPIARAREETRPPPVTTPTAPSTGIDGAPPRVSVADPDLVLRYIDSLRAARRALADYRWRERAAIRVDDRDWIVQVFDVRLARDGRLRHTLIGHEVTDPAFEQPFRRRLVPLEADASAAGVEPPPVTAFPFGGLPANEQAAALKRLAEAYTHPDPANVRRVPLLPAPLRSLQPLRPEPPASRTPGRPGNVGARDAPAVTSFELFDMIRGGDTYEVWVDHEDGEPSRMEARTDLDGAPVTVTAEYSRLPDGTPYRSRSSIRTVVEERTVEVHVDAFGFDKRGAAN